MMQDNNIAGGFEAFEGLPSDDDKFKLSDLQFSDLYIFNNEPDSVLIRSFDASEKLNKVPQHQVSDLGDVTALIEERSRNNDEFFIDHDSVRYRVTKVVSGQGITFCLRRALSKPPMLRDYNIATPYLKSLMHFGWKGHGLFLISAPTGAGKTTYGYSVLNEFLHEFGELSYEISSPPEMLFQGPIGRGFALQVEAPEEGYGEALVKAMRYNPRYIFLGEIRTPEAASEALRASINGHPVISTIHAGSIEEAINSMLKLAEAKSGPYGRDLLAQGLAGVCSQSLDWILDNATNEFRPSCKQEYYFFDASTPSAEAARSLIRDGKIEQLRTYIQQSGVKAIKGR